MNIERGLAQLGVSKTADPRAQSASKAQAEKPAFTLPDHGAEPNGASPHARASMQAPRTPQANASRTRETTRMRDRDDASRVESKDQARTHPQDTAKPTDAANAAARRDAHDGHRAARDHDDDAASAAASDAPSNAPTEDGEQRHAQAHDDGAALPDRMLALLSGEPLGMPATATSTALSSANTLAAAITDGSGAAAVLSGVPALATDPAGGAMRAGLPAVLPADAGASIALPAGLAASASASNTPTDAFAALAALADRTRDGGSAPADGTTTSSGSAFAPLLARGADALQGAARTAAVAAPAPLPLMLNADFDDGLGARVTWMAEQRIDHAQIRVSPEALGPIDVRLQMDGHRVNAQFHAANADVRQALESGMDRLRDMLGRQGMELGQAQVGSGSRQGSDGRGTGTSGSPGAKGGDVTPAEPQGMRVALVRSRGLLDEYA
jgi:flagellar hook-length control protein FliK